MFKNVTTVIQFSCLQFTSKQYHLENSYWSIQVNIKKQKSYGGQINILIIGPASV